MPVSPWTDASKLLVSAVFGDPEKRTELQKLDQQDRQFQLEYDLKKKADARDELYNPARVRQAEESANSAAAEAATKNFSLDSNRNRLENARRRAAGIGDALTGEIDSTKNFPFAPAAGAGVTPDQIAMVESGNNPNAVSPAGALGRMQVMPATAKKPGYGVTPARDSSDAENVRVGSDYYQAMLKKYGGNEKLALAAYNAGPGRVDSGAPLPAETVSYVQKFPNASGGLGDALSDQAPQNNVSLPDLLTSQGQPSVPQQAPWTDASKLLVSAVFGDPEKRTELQKLDQQAPTRKTDKQYYNEAYLDEVENAGTGVVDPKNVNARMIQYMVQDGMDPAYVYKISRQLNAGAGSPISQDALGAQAMDTERTSAELADLFAGKVAGSKPNIAELLSRQITTGPPKPGQTVMPEDASLGDKLVQAGMDANNIPLMNTGRGVKAADAMNDFRDENLINRQVTNYSKAADEVSAFVPAITNFATTLEKYPPGTNIPGIGSDTWKPSIMLSPEGRKVRQDFISVGNGIVYLLSGKQINEAEGRRLASQLGGTIENGTFELKNQYVDDQMRQGFANIARQVQSKLKNTGAMLGADALEEYKNRGGTVLPGMLDEIVNGGEGDVPHEAVQELLADPSPEAQAEFDDAFGAGAAVRALQGGQ